MRNLSRKRERFLNTTSNYSGLYNYSNQKEQLTVSSGVLNFIWNNWNNFWRDYWISHITGGVNLDDTPLTSIHSDYSDKQACHYLLFKLGKRNRHALGDSITSCYQEATWGDPDIIQNLAISLLADHSHMSYLLGVLGLYHTPIKHFQTVRNSFIHLNNENFFHLNGLSGYYSFTSAQKLVDILETTSIVNSTRCFDNLVDNMTGMIRNL